MTDGNIERTLGIMEGTLNGMDARQETMHTELREARVAQTKMLTKIVSTDTKILLHMDDDKRSFGLLFAMVGVVGAAVIGAIITRVMGLL